MENAVSVLSTLTKRKPASTMWTHTLYKISLWVGLVCALAMPLVPFVYQWLYPPVAQKLKPGVGGLLSFALGVLNSMSDGIMVMLWLAGLAAVAVLASVTGFSAAWIGHESLGAKWLSLLPVAMAAGMFGLLVAVGA